MYSMHLYYCAAKFFESKNMKRVQKITFLRAQYFFTFFEIQNEPTVPHLIEWYRYEYSI